MLTKKQYQLLHILKRHIESCGYSPSFDEMKNSLGLKSKSGIHRLISGLEERGFIRRLPHRARSLEILKMPNNSSDFVDNEFEDKTNIIKGMFTERKTVSSTKTSTVELPFYGRIAAGNPIEALRQESETIVVTDSFLGKGTHYALEVQGDSMIEAGINDGDIALIKETSSADNGSIVVALLDDNEVTLKRLRQKGQSIALEPANAKHETRIFGPNRVKIQGQLKAILRRY